MVSLKSKRRTETKLAKLENKTKYLSEEEEKVLKEQVDKEEEEQDKVNTVNLDKAIEVITEKFNLLGGNFVVTAFSDKRNKFQLSLSNEDFDITVMIKDTEKYDII